MKTIKELTHTFTSNGQLVWIGIRPERRVSVKAVRTAELKKGGFAGDHYSGSGKRAVTLIQDEHLPVIGSFLGGNNPEPELLRRNLVIRGLNLLGLRNREFRIGSAVLEGTGICAPCSRMEEILGHGGYTAVRGHGGITARVIEPGVISIGDKICPASPLQNV